MLLVKGLQLLNGKNVDLELREGEGYVLEGPNGSGKSVLLRTLAGLYPATSSQFEYRGKKADEYSAEDYRTRVLYVGSTTHFSGEMTAEEFLEAPFKLSVYRGHRPETDFKNYLMKWGVQGKKLAVLSSGQKQLLVILRAMSLKAELLLLDEPTSHMDREKTLETEKMLSLWKSQGRSYLIISHSDDQAQRLGKRIQFSSLVKN
jgi:putative ABC transport system ATP-binding protein